MESYRMGREKIFLCFLLVSMLVNIIGGFSCFEKNPGVCRSLYYGYTLNLDIYSLMKNNSQQRCPYECEDGKEDANCLDCFCARDYQLNVSSVGQLNITEDVERNLFEQPTQNASYHKVIYVESNLTTWPLNLCNFTKIVLIDFHGNKLQNVPDIKCLTELDVLKLSYNKIAYIASGIFNGLKNLRMVDLSYNSINTIEAETFSDTSLNFLFLELQYNNLTSIDVSNFFLDKRFCAVNYSHNEIKEISHAPEWNIKSDLDYGPGVISLRSNLLEYVDFRNMVEKDISLAFEKMFDFGFDVTENKWICDCRMYPLLNITSEVHLHVWRDFYDVNCFQPDEMKNQSIPQLAIDGKLDKFICNITDPCPTTCQCFDQPSRNTTVIDCDNAGLTAMPDALPKRPTLEIHMSNNTIPVLDSKDYLKNTTYLDMSNNDLKTITEAGATMLQGIDTVILDNNSLHSLPKNLHLSNPCSLYFGLVNLTCSCDLLWINSWMENKNGSLCPDFHQFKCYLRGKLVDFKFEDEFSLGCDSNLMLALEDLWIVVGLFVLFVIIACVEIYFFRYEIFLLCRRSCSSKRRSHSYKMTERVYVSFDETDQNMRDWVEGPLNDFLNKQNLQVFMPCRDLQLGQLRERETFVALRGSRYTLAIFSRGYFEKNSFWPRFEWRRTWDLYLKDRKRRIIIIKYDDIKTANIRSAKAFLRLKFFHDITIDENVFLEKLANDLGTRHVINDPADDFPEQL